MKITQYDQSFSGEDSDLNRPTRSFSNFEDQSYSRFKEGSNEGVFMEFNDSFCQ